MKYIDNYQKIQRTYNNIHTYYKTAGIFIFFSPLKASTCIQDQPEITLERMIKPVQTFWGSLNG